MDPGVRELRDRVFPLNTAEDDEVINTYAPHLAYAFMEGTRDAMADWGLTPEESRLRLAHDPAPPDQSWGAYYSRGPIPTITIATDADKMRSPDLARTSAAYRRVEYFQQYNAQVVRGEPTARPLPGAKSVAPERTERGSIGGPSADDRAYAVGYHEAMHHAIELRRQTFERAVGYYGKPDNIGRVSGYALTGGREEALAELATFARLYGVDALPANLRHVVPVLRDLVRREAPYTGREQPRARSSRGGTPPSIEEVARALDTPLWGQQRSRAAIGRMETRFRNAVVEGANESVKEYHRRNIADTRAADRAMHRSAMTRLAAMARAAKRRLAAEEAERG
jgi:hypothetical protein